MHRYSSSTLKQQPTNNRQLCIISEAIKTAVCRLNVLSLKEVHLYNTSVASTVELRVWRFDVSITIGNVGRWTDDLKKNLSETQPESRKERKKSLSQTAEEQTRREATKMASWATQVLT